MLLILTKNQFKFNGKHYAQTDKLAVAFSVIFMPHVEKQLLHASHFSGRDLLMTYSQCGLFLKPKSTTLLISRTLPTQQ